MVILAHQNIAETYLHVRAHIKTSLQTYTLRNMKGRPTRLVYVLREGRELGKGKKLYWTTSSKQAHFLQFRAFLQYT